MSQPQIAIDAVEQVLTESQKQERLKDAVQALLELHIAHHNNPTHAAARALLAELKA